MMLEVSIRHRLSGFTLDAAFTAGPGVTAIFGQSGAGKTTLINAVAGVLRPDSGRITLNGAVLSEGRIFIPPHRRRIGYVFQDGRLFPHLTVKQNLLYGRWFSKGRSDPARIIAMLGIAPLLDRRPARLSGGEKQRVAIGRALLSDPRLLLLDEPLAALDTARKAEILPYLERLKEERLPILYVSHSVGEVVRLAETVILIEAGSVRAAGSPSAILSDPEGGLPAREAGALIDARVVAQEPDGLTRVAISGGDLFLPLVAQTGAALRVRIHAQDVMIARERPNGLSALNILPATVQSVSTNGAQSLVLLRVGTDPVLANITTRSATALGLQNGAECFAILKSVAIADQSFSDGTDNGSVGATTGVFSARSR